MASEADELLRKKDDPLSTSSSSEEITKQEVPLFDDFHRKVKELQPIVFDGIRLMISRPISPNLQLSHTLAMGGMASQYRFSANYMGTKKVSPMEAYPILASEISCDGTLNANFIHMTSPRTRTKLVVSFQKNVCTGSQLSVDYRGDNFTTSVAGVNIDLVKNSGILIGHMTHQLTKSIVWGPELLLQYTQPKDNSLRMLSQLSLGCRYEADKYQINTTLSMGGAHISYFQKANEDLQLGAELMTDASMNHNMAAFYYQYDLRKSNVSFKGSMDTAWNVGAVLEKRFLPLPVTFSMSAVLNHVKNSTSVGLGLQVN